MSEKLAQIAERAAMNASRREFLGRLGRSAAGAAGVLGGWLMLPRKAEAGRKACHGVICPPGYNFCCHAYDHLAGKVVFFCSTGSC